VLSRPPLPASAGGTPETKRVAAPLPPSRDRSIYAYGGWPEVDGLVAARLSRGLPRFTWPPPIADPYKLGASGLAYKNVMAWLLGARMLQLYARLDGLWLAQLSQPGGAGAWIVWAPEAGGRGVLMPWPAEWGPAAGARITHAVTSRAVTVGRGGLLVGRVPLLVRPAA
jgi:hypothetical protein